MNNRFLNIFTIIASSSLFLAGCSEDNSSFETPNTSDIETNPGIVSQKNMSIGADNPNPAVYIFDAVEMTETFTETSVQISVKVGDINNQLLTDSHTIFFATEWGLIAPSCVTEKGECSVTWQTSSFANIPGDLLTTIIAWTIGEESFDDTNGNKIFDDSDSIFEDREEPYVDANWDGVFNAGDTLIDVINGNDSSGINGVHDIGDTFLNSPNCTHSSLCSTVQPTTSIWVEFQLNMDASTTP